jgi:hypothetical protein
MPQGGTFLFRLIRSPKFISPNEVRGHILSTLQKYERLFKADFEETVATWRSPAAFRTKVRYAQGRARVAVLTDDKKWRWLNYGTSVRYAHMGQGFKRKTHPGQLKSGPGNPPFDPIFIGRPPKKGIEPRNWHVLIREKHRDAFREDIRVALLTGLRKAKAKGKI